MGASALSLADDDDVGRRRDDALTRLFAEHYGSLLGTARLLVDDRASAEEVVQEAFVRLHGAWSGLRAPEAAPAYLRATVVNLARGRLRHRIVVRRHDETTPRPTPEPDEDLLRGEQQRLVVQALRALPRRQRECLVLRYYLGLSEREIAGSLGIAAGSVKTHVHRGLARLTEELEVLR